MTDHIRCEIRNRIGYLHLERPKALNSLSLDMVRALTQALLAWRDDPRISAVLIQSTSEKAFCAGGDIRFFHEVGNATSTGHSALLEDFFSEEYALNHLIHHYPKPYIAIMDGIVMGGGMGIAQGGDANRMRIVTERTKMAMPEVNIGLFPDVGGSYFLTRVPGELGTYLGITGETVGAADALHASLADVFIPASELPALREVLASTNEADMRAVIRSFAAPFQTRVEPAGSALAINRAAIDKHFAHDDVRAIAASLAQDDMPFARKTLQVMEQRSPLMMCVTLEQLRRGARLTVADCLRMERTLVRRSFEHGEVLEGVRALVIDKDNAPQWNPPTLEQVTPEMVTQFFESAWPAHAHPLRDLT
ncbi:enoyl-CoA hydratase/isomerase family protein [Noviherbaspirillum cavernae]|uniref:Enoyl-CoA hydratase/isomerase family protein n=1 Tax=Noviherbaspirillum cavernae TaxID=2320862 RepID=A0A418X4D5_9BURK|nr:enoyl-CoA hydratase/isomerase family protein [Noviherbaspirillum cavernae]RJG07286.1 enoyl-CoA hydratase/isomerase family protein [Noviherbaspirillum cavernae]